MNFLNLIRWSVFAVSLSAIFFHWPTFVFIISLLIFVFLSIFLNAPGQAPGYDPLTRIEDYEDARNIYRRPERKKRNGNQ